MATIILTAGLAALTSFSQAPISSQGVNHMQNHLTVIDADAHVIETEHVGLYDAAFDQLVVSL